MRQYVVGVTYGSMVNQMTRKTKIIPNYDTLWKVGPFEEANEKNIIRNTHGGKIASSCSWEYNAVQRYVILALPGNANYG
mmetsp:Transcript_13790/g.29961  ORF Transcript_13790/g.29961 Transcript_13790/m.29961 type:complete len:80 (-) Transcript_13790:236-475(-)